MEVAPLLKSTKKPTISWILKLKYSFLNSKEVVFLPGNAGNIRIPVYSSTHAYVNDVLGLITSHLHSNELINYYCYKF